MARTEQALPAMRQGQNVFQPLQDEPRMPELSRRILERSGRVAGRDVCRLRDRIQFLSDRVGSAGLLHQLVRDCPARDLKHGGGRQRVSVLSAVAQFVDAADLYFGRDRGSADQSDSRTSKDPALRATIFGLNDSLA